MVEIRRSNERGRAQLGWLDSRHTFSFADYYDPAYMGFASLRVINEDRVAPGAGFPTHAHRDMEILTYPLQGALEHRDSLGTGSVIRPGDVQRMSAGTGVRHSEYNHSKTEPVHFFQIWIVPARTGLAPGYEQKHFDDSALHGGLRLVASPDGRDGSVTVHQDALLYAGRLDAGQTVHHAPAAGRHVYLQVAKGRLSLNHETLQAGDGAGIIGETEITIRAQDAAELLLFDLG